MLTFDEPLLLDRSSYWQNRRFPSGLIRHDRHVTSLQFYNTSDEYDHGFIVVISSVFGFNWRTFYGCFTRLIVLFLHQMNDAWNQPVPQIYDIWLSMDSNYHTNIWGLFWYHLICLIVRFHKVTKARDWRSQWLWHLAEISISLPLFLTIWALYHTILCIRNFARSYDKPPYRKFKWTPDIHKVAAGQADRLWITAHCSFSQQHPNQQLL